MLNYCSWSQYFAQQKHYRVDKPRTRNAYAKGLPKDIWNLVQIEWVEGEIKQFPEIIETHTTTEEVLKLIDQVAVGAKDKHDQIGIVRGLSFQEHCQDHIKRKDDNTTNAEANI